MKRFQHLLFFVLAVGALAAAQQPVGPPVNTPQLILPLYSANITPATQANVVLVGNPGPQTIYYWMVSNSTVGPSSPVGPFAVTNAPNVLSGSNYVNVYPGYPAGINSIDLLKTSTPTPPSGTCNCAVATGVTSGVISDQNNSTIGYAVTPINISALTYTLSNEAQSSGISHVILRQNGVFVDDLSVSGGTGSITGAGAGGGLVVTGTTLGLLTSCSSTQVLAWNGSAWACALGAGSVTGATAAGGLALTGTTLGLLTSCSSTQVLAWNGSAWACALNNLPNPMTALGDAIGGGTAGAPTRVPAPTSPNGVPFVLTEIPAAGAGTLEAFTAPGIPGRAYAGTTDTIAPTDCNPNRVEYVGTAAVTVTLPTATTLGVPSCVFRLANQTSGPGGAVTVSPTTWTCSISPCVINQGQIATFYVDPNLATQWNVDLQWLNTIPVNNLVSATGAIGILADGNNPLTINSAQTSNNQSAINFGETTAATGGTGNNEVSLSTLANSASTVLNLLQGAISTVFPIAGLNLVQGANTGATNVPGASFAGTWNNASIVGPFFKIAVTNTASTAGSPIFQVFGGAGGATSEFNVNTAGVAVTPTAFQSALFEGATLSAGTQFCSGPCTAALSGPAGIALYQGGDNSSANVAAAGGPSVFRGGMLTAATPNAAALEGVVQLGSGFLKGAALVAFGDSVSATSTAFTVTDSSHTAPVLPILGCANSIVNPVGVVGIGQAICKIDSAVAALGDVICTGSTTDGVMHDNGTAMCLKPGSLVGIVIADAGTAVTMTGATSGGTALSTTLVLVQLARGGGGAATQMLTAAYTNAATTTYSTVFTFPVQPSQNIAITCQLYYQGSATTAVPSIQFMGPASPTSVRYGSNATLTSGSSPTFYSASTNAYASALTPAAIVTTATDMVQTVIFGLQNGTTGGSVLLKAAPNGAGTLTYQINSSCVESAQ